MQTQSEQNYKQKISSRIYNHCLQVVKFTNSLNKNLPSNPIITKQVIRSSTSIGANFIEAQAGSSQKDFINFLNYALKSANETVFWLNLLKDTNHSSSDVSLLISETQEISRILGSSLVKLRKK